jgi:hypothetical protein
MHQPYGQLPVGIGAKLDRSGRVVHDMRRMPGHQRRPGLQQGAGAEGMQGSGLVAMAGL